MNDRLAEQITRLSINLCVTKKRREKDRKRISGEQLNDAQKKGEAREAHRLSRMVAGRGMGARRRHQPRIPAIRQCLEEGVKTLEQPINKGGCSGLLITFSDARKIRPHRSGSKRDTTWAQGLDISASCSLEAPALESVCRVEHPSRTSEDTNFFPNGGAQ